MEHPVNEDGSFTLPEDHVRIKAEFESISFLIEIEDTPNGHIVTLPKAAKEHDLISVWVIPDTGYRYEKGTLKYKLLPSNAETSISDDSWTFNINASHVRISANFIKIPQTSRTVKVHPTEHGIIIPYWTYGYYNKPVPLTIIPEPGYQLRPGSLRYQKEGSTDFVHFSGTSIPMPSSHITLYGEFVRK
jgi:hypothetical protein